MPRRSWLAHKYGPNRKPDGPAVWLGRVFAGYVILGVVAAMLARAGSLSQPGFLGSMGILEPLIPVYISGLLVIVGLWWAFSWFGAPRLGLYEWVVLVFQASLLSGIVVTRGWLTEWVGDSGWMWGYLICGQMLFLVGGAFLIHAINRTHARDGEMSNKGLRWLLEVSFLPLLVVPTVIAGVALALVSAPLWAPLLAMILLVVGMFAVLLKLGESPQREVGYQRREKGGHSEASIESSSRTNNPDDGLKDKQS